MQTLYVFGGVSLGAGIDGAATLNPVWGWCIALGAMLVVIGVMVETTYK